MSGLLSWLMQGRGGGPFPCAYLTLLGISFHREVMWKKGLQFPVKFCPTPAQGHKKGEATLILLLRITHPHKGSPESDPSRQIWK